MAQVQKGVFEVVNPFNRKITLVPATAQAVHTIVFWSKNFAPFIQGKFGQKLLDRGFNLFFNFTINSTSPLLEPQVPPLSDRLNQLALLSRKFGAAVINWRFDPICFYKNSNDKSDHRPTGQIRHNRQDFPAIAAAAAQCGISRCITSFMDFYPKIKKRTAALNGFDFIDPPAEQKLAILLEMEKILSPLSIGLYTCCEKEILKMLPPNAGIKAGACIPNDLLVELFGGKLSLAQDRGQRVKAGCGCMQSVDIGNYQKHPCRHSCLFCYANPTRYEIPQIPAHGGQALG